MNSTPLRFGSTAHEHLADLIDGHITIDGSPVQYTSSTLATEIFVSACEQRDIISWRRQGDDFASDCYLASEKVGLPSDEHPLWSRPTRDVA